MPGKRPLYSHSCYKCPDCDSWGHKLKQSKWCSKSVNSVENNALNNLCSIFIGMEIGVIRNSAELKLATVGTSRKGRRIPLHHHIFENNSWVAGPPASQPTCWTTATPCPKDHADFGHPVDDPRSLHQTQVSTVTDTGSS